MYDEPSHISNENGISLLSGKGYGAVIERRFFENITCETAEPWEALADILGDSGREKSTEVVSDAWWYYGLSYFIFPAFFWWDQPC